MKLDVGGHVVDDPWLLVRSGGESADTRALVEACLAEDAALAATLRASESFGPAVPALRLSPDAERRLLIDARQRARLKSMVMGGAAALGGLLLLVALAGALLVVARSMGTGSRRGAAPTLVRWCRRRWDDHARLRTRDGTHGDSPGPVSVSRSPSKPSRSSPAARSQHPRAGSRSTASRGRWPSASVSERCRRCSGEWPGRC
ncbi:MAG: hypothetical protein AB1625_15340 [Acidobacteriota bacterium]